MTEPKILQRGETAIRYWLDGPDGAPLGVLTHGATADHTMFDDMVPVLAARYRVLRWDVPGHGLSQPLPGDFGMDRLVADELALIETAGERRAVLVGQSMGGNLAQEVVFRHPDRVAALPRRLDQRELVGDEAVHAEVPRQRLRQPVAGDVPSQHPIAGREHRDHVVEHGVVGGR